MWERLAGERRVAAVFGPTTAGQVDAHHALDVDALGAFDQEPPAFGGAGESLRVHGKVVRIIRDDVVRYDVPRPLEPELAQLRQDTAFPVYGLRHHHVEGRDAIGGDHQQTLVDHIHLADL